MFNPWEYRAITVETLPEKDKYVLSARNKHIEAALMEMGNQGWELISFLPAARLAHPRGGVPDIYHAIFKRQKNSYSRPS